MEFGIVYSKNTGRIRSIVVPENENEQHILDLVKLNTGEAIIRFDTKELDKEEVLQEKLNKITGLVPQNDRYIIVDPTTNKIEGVVIADEKIDSVSGKKMIANAEADVNWTYDKSAKRYTKPII